MIKNFRNWLLQKHNLQEMDIFESAKLRLVLNFSSYLFLFNILGFVMSLFVLDLYAMIIVFTAFSLHLTAIISIRFQSSYQLPAKILSINMVIGLIVISFLNRGIIDLMYLSHAFVAIIFAHFTLGKKWSLFLSLLFSCYVFIMTYLHLSSNILLFQSIFNPNFNDTIFKIASPFVTFINVFIVLKLLDFNSSNQTEALKIVSNSNKLKEGILGVVAHDLRGPIANIVVLNEFLRANITEPHKDDGESIDYTNMIDDMCQRSLSIINDLVDVAEIESKGYVLDLEKSLVNEYFIKVIDSQKLKASLKAIEINFIPLANDKYVYLHLDKFARVIENLISNAIKFTKTNGEINIAIIDKPNHILIKFEDNGIGIPTGLQNNIFDKFTSSGRRGTAGEKSLGIGLSITKRIVELHKGKIWFVSEPGTGTSFFVQLPKSF